MRFAAEKSRKNAGKAGKNPPEPEKPVTLKQSGFSAAAQKRS